MTMAFSVQAENTIYGELGIYGQYVTDTGDTSSTGNPGIIAGVFYANDTPFDVGVEGAALGWGTGQFLTVKTGIGDKFKFLMGAGQMGYKVDNEYNDFYTKELATMFGASISTGHGDFVLRIITSQYKDPMGRKSTVGNCEYDEHWEVTCNPTSSLGSKGFVKQSIMLGYQLQF